MAKCVLIFNSDDELITQAAFDFRNELTIKSNLCGMDIFVLYANPFLYSHVLDELDNILEQCDPDEPLMLVYIGGGTKNGWLLKFRKARFRVPYTQLAKLLTKYKMPILFINCCYYSKTAITPFKRLLNAKRREFEMITPFETTEGGWHGYFLNTEFLGSLEHNWKYDPSFWNNHAADVTFGTLPKFEIKKGVDGFNEVIVEGDGDKNDNPPSGRSRHGKMVQSHFWITEIEQKAPFKQHAL